MNVNYVIIKSAVFLSNFTVRQTLETNLVLNRADLLYGLCAVPNSLGTQLNHCKSPFPLQSFRQGYSQLEHMDLAQGSQKQNWLSEQSHCLGSGRQPAPRDIQHLGLSWSSTACGNLRTGRLTGTQIGMLFCNGS